MPSGVSSGFVQTVARRLRPYLPFLAGLLLLAMFAAAALAVSRAEGSAHPTLSVRMVSDDPSSVVRAVVAELRRVEGGVGRASVRPRPWGDGGGVAGAVPRADVDGFVAALADLPVRAELRSFELQLPDPGVEVLTTSRLRGLEREVVSRRADLASEVASGAANESVLAAADRLRSAESERAAVAEELSSALLTGAPVLLDLTVRSPFHRARAALALLALLAVLSLLVPVRRLSLSRRRGLAPPPNL